MNIGGISIFDLLRLKNDRRVIETIEAGAAAWRANSDGVIEREEIIEVGDEFVEAMASMLPATMTVEQSTLFDELARMVRQLHKAAADGEIDRHEITRIGKTFVRAVATLAPDRIQTRD